MQPTVAEGNFIAEAFSAGGPVMYVIALIGLLVIFLIFERASALKSLTLNKKEFIDNIYGMTLRGDIKQAIAYCDSRSTPLTAVIKAGLVQVMNGRSDEEVQVAMDAAILRESPRLSGWSSFLAVLGNIGVLSGLLGTIFGMIKSFGALADADPAEKAEKLSMGISHALNATAFGLSVAIAAIVAFGVFQLLIQRAEDDVVETSMTFMNLVVSNRDKVKVN